MGYSYATVKRPYISKVELEDEATSFLREHYQDALNYPLAVPIVQIASDMGINIICHERLTEDFSILGQMIFGDTEVDIYKEETMEYVALSVTKGTMLVDQHTGLVAGRGCYNNTVAHEAFHWYRHRDYFEGLIKSGVGGISATRCNRDQIEGRIKGKLTSDIDWIEWQANNIAPRILMPFQSFTNSAEEIARSHKGYYKSKEYTFKKVVHELADYYHVSFTSAAIRFQELGLSKLLC